MDALTDKAEVVEAVREATQNLEENVKLRLSNANSRERHAFITMSFGGVKEGKLKSKMD